MPGHLRLPALRTAMGGWIALGLEERSRLFGRQMWAGYSRYVGEHDESWIHIQAFWLAVAMLVGFECLIFRYLGSTTEYYQPAEAGAVVTLAALNAGAAWLALRSPAVHAGARRT